ncbi:TetR family transcriptional regulator [Acinetobacter sp. VNH17]|jgi:AcrR family transcriptional regulator|uniref:TetR family transcriptional regulator n=1 Tax=Acinetobacter thutiue TaxID=2998078 RepID=A0ABT7WR17_9GAMM|nr:TetR family transcriptional regulator [Acinetobacter thutiue]MCY6413022.1 TetR family transcriptional regulator [Acinetobacter thutiue]MDN0015130.1 TetR family transcriptional regulator [Acinetobacter thutiue]MDN8286317.1 TetR family transcriptional regulator [Acinetobacter baumannii]
MTVKIPNLREQQKAAIRKDLIIKGVELFLKQGFVNTTVDQIVEPLGIAKRTFFRYFSTKEDLLFAWQIEKVPELVQELNNRPSDETPYTAVCNTLASLLTRYDQNPKLALAFMALTKETSSLIGKEYEKRIIWEQGLAVALIKREGEKQMPPLKARIIVGTVMSAWTAALDEWFESGGQADLRPIVKKAFAMINES